MKTATHLLDEHFREYISLLARLQQFFLEGKEDSPEADALRDRMDRPWDALSPEQSEIVAGLCADLNGMIDGPSPGTNPSESELLQESLALREARDAGDMLAVLRHLRALTHYHSPAEVAALRAEAWDRIGETEMARLFSEYARKLDGREGRNGAPRVS